MTCLFVLGIDYGSAILELAYSVTVADPDGDETSGYVSDGSVVFMLPLGRSGPTGASDASPLVVLI